MRTDSYRYYLGGFETEKRPLRETAIPMADGAFKWEDGGGPLEWAFTVEEEGLYSIELTYFVEAARQAEIEISLYINGDVPFTAASRLKLMREWRDDGEITSDMRGNDLRPPVAPRGEWLKKTFRDYEGLYSEPYVFYFKVGENTISLEKRGGTITLASIRLHNDAPPPPYAEYAAGKTAVESGPVRVEGERYSYKSHTSILSKFDRSGAATQPNDPKLILLNTVGQDCWSRQGQYIAWEVTVGEAGYYPIGVRFRQSSSRALTSYRRLYINGYVPFAEADAIPFKYSTGWQTQYLSDASGEPYLFCLEAGKNEIMLEVAPGPVAHIIAELDDMLFTLSTIYRKMVMITGVTADPLRDYQLERNIPGILDEFARVEKGLAENKAALVSLGKRGGLGDSSAILTTLRVQLGSFVKKPLEIARRVRQFQQNISSFANFVNSLREMPLEIDYLVAGGTDKTGFIKVSLINSAIYSINSFFATFTTDYNLIGDVETGAKTIEVWINGDPTSGYGRDQTQVLTDLVRDYLTPHVDFQVSIKLVQQALIPAILSGGGPDVALFVGGSEPVILACRGGVADFDRFDGLEEVLSRFNPQALVPMQYDGKLYGLPLTQNFPMMFCRTDILDELELEPPGTWDEFYRALTVLQRNNLTFGVPNMAPGQPMHINNSIYAMLLYQMGGSYFNEERTQTRFNEEVSIAAFEQWTGFYRDHGLLTEYYFFQRFRAGDMPIGIEGYTMYNQLMIAAPELRGLWKMFPVPGYDDGNGNVNNTVMAGGLAAVILSNSAKQDEAFEFLKWLTSAEVQSLYGLQIEAMMNVRYDTANLEAFKDLPWTDDEQALILGEWAKVSAVPVIPASYSLERNLTNAFRNTVIAFRNPRETLNRYNAEINEEIRRKQLEFTR